MVFSYMRAFLLGAVLLVGITGFAGTASAATVSCESHIRDFTPYVYEDGLNSFDLFYDGAGAPVVLETTVAGRVLEPRYTSIWDGAVTKIHVDVPGWYGFSGTVPVRVTVASLNGCLETAQFDVFVPKAAPKTSPVVQSGTGHATPAISQPSPVKVATPVTPEVIIAPTQEAETLVTPETPVSGPFRVSCTAAAALSWGVGHPMPLSHIVERREIGFGKFVSIAKLPGGVSEYVDDSSDGKAYVYRVVRLNADSTVSVSEPTPCYTPETVVVTPTTTSGFAAACSSWGGSVWGFLLALHLAAAVITISYLQSLIAGNGWRFTTALFIPFAITLGLWFWFDTCRANQWFPISVSLITLIALIIGPAFSDQEPEDAQDVSTHVTF